MKKEPFQRADPVVVDGELAGSWGKGQENIKKVLNASTAVLVADKRGRIVDANERFCRIARIDRDEIVGEHYGDLTSVRFSQDFSVIWQQILSGDPWEGELECRAETGQLSWLCVTLVSLFKDGELDQVILVGHDISHYRQDPESSSAWLRSNLWLERVKQDYLQQRKDEPVLSSLSLREEQVLKLVAEGLANKNIASRLNISVRTVEIHRAHLLQKLGLKTTAALVKYALEHGYST